MVKLTSWFKGMDSCSLFKPGTCFAGMTVTGVFQVCHFWLDQESKNCKSIVTMKYKEDTCQITNVCKKMSEPRFNGLVGLSGLGTKNANVFSCKSFNLFNPSSDNIYVFLNMTLSS
ncbi:hypothetical protein MBAV_002569 [Candidatus Magnetobacterium bavaricum]|uniref:Uncharacterized protein n=1 Tax=Candidatus Magnetobacterium bavaricum TaxID=29290 RepID=A0A0F3GTR2_9BACT|nr:hypothetical protein MBAV_002569 [Candidatus Magnetobacterium bavaricum]